MRRKLSLDPQKICATGGSAGGHLVLFLGVTGNVPEFEGTGPNRDQSSRVSCVVSMYGPSDLTKSYGRSVDAAEVLPLFLGGDVAHAREAHLRASPLNWVTPDAPPTLAIQGTKDRYVNYEQSVWIIDRLLAAGVEAEIETIEGADHGFKGADAERAEKRMIGFFETPLEVIVSRLFGLRQSKTFAKNPVSPYPGCSERVFLCSNFYVESNCYSFWLPAQPCFPSTLNRSPAASWVTSRTRQGAVIVGAQVTARNQRHRVFANRADQRAGRVPYRLLPPGNYEVQVLEQRLPVSSSGRHRAGRRPVRARRRAGLEIGEAASTIQVEGAAPLVNTTDATVGQTVGTDQITTLPLVNRNVYSLLTLTPGVQQTSNAIALGFPAQRTFINGGADATMGSVNYYLDGGTEHVDPAQHRQHDTQSRRNRGVPRRYQQLQRGVRTLRQRRHQRHHALGHQSDPRLGLRVFPQHALNANTWNALTKPPLASQSVRRHAGRPDHP